jgi:excisionase family DNA binding protein
VHLEHEVLSVREVAAVLRVSEDTVRNEISRGKLAAIMVGRGYRIPAEVLERYLGLDVKDVGRSGGALDELIDKLVDNAP